MTSWSALATMIRSTGSVSSAVRRSTVRRGATRTMRARESGPPETSPTSPASSPTTTLLRPSSRAFIAVTTRSPPPCRRLRARPRDPAVRRLGSMPYFAASSSSNSSSTPACAAAARRRVDRGADVPRPAVCDDGRTLNRRHRRSSASSSPGSSGCSVVDEVEDELMVSLRARAVPSLRPRRRAPTKPSDASATSRSDAPRAPRVADDALRRVGAARLELRLHQHERLPAGRRERERRRQRRLAREMNETSQVTSCGANGSSVSVPRVRPLEHGDARIAAQALRAAGRGRRRARSPARAPRCSSTSVNPPVDAPRSRQSSPAGSTPNASSAFASLCPRARRTAAAASTSSSARLVDLLARLGVARDEPGHHERLRLRPALGQAALDEQDVEALFTAVTNVVRRARRARPRSRSAPPCRRRSRRAAPARARPPRRRGRARASAPTSST